MPQRSPDDAKKISIMATANDAIRSKLSTACRGYYNDPFLPHFAENAKGHAASGSRRSFLSSTSSRSCLENEDGGPSSSLQFRPMSSFAGNGWNETGPLHLRSSYLNRYEHEESESSTDRHSVRSAPFNHYSSSPNWPGSSHRNGRMHPGIPSSHYPYAIQQQDHQPLIRRGTHARVCVMDYAISHFASIASQSSNDPIDSIQIVILGSGRDTSYLRAQCGLLHGGLSSKSRNRPKHISWYEVDHGTVIESKKELLEGCTLLDLKCEGPNEKHGRSVGTNGGESVGTNGGESVGRKSYHVITKRIRNTALSSSTTSRATDNSEKLESSLTNGWIEVNEESNPYHLIEYDLCDPLDDLFDYMTEYHSFQVEIPTLFLMECVQMYLPENSSRKLLSTITQTCHNSYLALYDPILQNDTFGTTMANNLRQSGITDSSTSLWQTKTLKSQIQKLADCGFLYAVGCDMMDAYVSILKEEDRRRANRCEMLDEVEEWMLLMKHYCFLVASTTRCKERKGGDMNMAARFCVDSSDPYQTGSLGFAEDRCTIMAPTSNKDK